MAVTVLVMARWLAWQKRGLTGANGFEGDDENELKGRKKTTVVIVVCCYAPSCSKAECR